MPTAGLISCASFICVDFCIEVHGGFEDLQAAEDLGDLEDLQAVEDVVEWLYNMLCLWNLYTCSLHLEGC